MYNSRRFIGAALLFMLALLGAVLLHGSSAVQAAPKSPDPTSVTIAGSLQSELGCPGDWQPECANTHLAYSADDDVWQGSFDLPANTGDEHYEYKAALNGTWDENYGLHAVPGGDNIPLPPLTQTTAVKFYYDHKSHWITDNKTSVIAVAPGSFQSELGCPGDWQPDCLRSWLQDIDGDGIYNFHTTALPAGSYEGKVALNESWDVNYGADCALNGGNVPFNVAAAGDDIEFDYNSNTHCLTIHGAQHGGLNLSEAQWLSHDTIAWQVPCADNNTYALHWSATASLALTLTGVIGGDSVPLTCDTSGLGAALLAKFPQLSGYSALKLPNSVTTDQIKDILKAQIAVSANDPSGALIDATEIQIPGVLDDVYAAAGSQQLGLLYTEMTPTLRLWAPTAQDVKLHVYDNSNGGANTVVPMTYDANTGIWTATGGPAWNGKYYLYEVKVFTRVSSPQNQIVTNMVSDPYSVNLSMNSTRSQIVNLDDAALKPTGWDSLVKPALAAPEDIALYELHVRDFSVNDPTVPAAHQGTYLAFTDNNSAGMTHLRELAQAGLTHIHILPAFDCASINENKSTWQSPSFATLASFPPTSTQQADLINATKDQDAFNWCYDPFHFNTPEGSYATTATGTTRIIQFRQMVAGLAHNGLRVVMDVVYNHTSDSGQSDRSTFDKIVPGYYYRLNGIGSVETSSCCQNTATEHMMMGKFVVDSTVMWAKEYKVDGFRFDIMGHQPKANIVAVQTALHNLTPANDGVDGSKIYIYGEGWNFGEVQDNSHFVQATQANMAGTGVGSFNDRMRDGARGGGPFDPKPEQGFTNGLFFDSNNNNHCDGHLCSSAEEYAKLLRMQDYVKIGMMGTLANYTMVDRFGNTVKASQIDYGGQHAGYTQDPQEIINYDEAHDNETLFDVNVYKAPLSTTTTLDRARMQNIGLDVVALAQGIPFFHAGQDLLRSKSLDGNSYNSGDWFNRIDWTGQDNGFGSGVPASFAPGSDADAAAALLAHTATIKPTAADIALTENHFREILAVRKSSKLFRLQTGQEVMDKVSYYNNGPDEQAGLIVQMIDNTKGTPVADMYSRIVTLVNANDAPQTYTIASLVGMQFSLHPILASSTDAVVRTASFDAATGAFWVPARTTAVFVQRGQCDISFTDVPSDYFAAGYIRWAACRGIMSGYSDNTFRPEANTTRGQVAKIVVLAVGMPINLTGAPHFVDVPRTDPFYPFIETAFNRGIISGYNVSATSFAFHTYAQVTRAQVAKIIVLASGVPLENPASPTFTDVAPADWSYKFVETAVAHAIVGGYDDHTFRPYNNTTRAQLAKIVFQAWAVPADKPSSGKSDK